MANYASRVLSLRIDPALLEAVREQARDAGRSVSGQIVFFLRERVEPARGRSWEGPKPITGWLSHRDVLATHEEFRRGRRAASTKVRAAIRRKARAR